MVSGLPVGVYLLEIFDKSLEKVGGFGRARVQGMFGMYGVWWSDIDDGLFAADGRVANQGFKGDGHQNR